MIGETISQWFLSLPMWTMITWLIGSGVLYSLGINLSRNKSAWWLCTSFIAIIMGWILINAAIFDAGLKDNTLIMTIPVLVAITLIIVMMAWGSPQKPKHQVEP